MRFSLDHASKAKIFFDENEADAAKTGASESFPKDDFRVMVTKERVANGAVVRKQGWVIGKFVGEQLVGLLEQ